METRIVKPSNEERQLLTNFTGELCPEEIDFNWLMSLVENIESLGFEVDIMRGVSIQTPDHYTKRIVKAGETKIDAVYKAVVEFATWYNQKSLTS